MLRLVSVFVVLFAAAMAFTSLLPSPVRRGLPASTPAQAAVAETDAASVRAEKAVRVVYPPTDGTAKMSSPAAVVPDPSAMANLSAVRTPVTPVTVAPVALPDATPGTAKLDINTASAKALDNIAGAGRIGRTIVLHRPYRSVEDLLSKRVIRKGVYDRIKDQVALQ